MTDFIMQNYGCPDIIFNNATITKMGSVDEVEISFWDKSYAVNLKAPLLLTQGFLPQMKERKSGTIVFVSSSGASPYMGAYEVFKTAQVELSNTLAMELENSGVHTFAIGPGLVKTETAIHAIEIVAKNMGMSPDEFYIMNGQHILDVESAGIGFALSTVEQASKKLNIIFQEAQNDPSIIVNEHSFFEKLHNYWKHQLQLLQGYERDKNKLMQNKQIINGWIKDIECLLSSK